MSHVTNDYQRNMNSEMRNCPYLRQEFRTVIKEDLYGEEYTDNDWVEVNECGQWKTLSAAQDQCTKCGKVFTY
jgi:hypothetical protein